MPNAQRLAALADSWDGGESAGIAHVAGCGDYSCSTCAVIACAADLRAMIAAAAERRQ